MDVYSQWAEDNFKVFDNDTLRQRLNERDVKTVIPLQRNRTIQIEHEREVHKWCHLIENFSAKLKESRRYPLRQDQQQVQAVIHLTVIVLVLRWISTGPNPDFSHVWTGWRTTSRIHP
ncbi:MAG: hypothetical protein ACJ8AW_30955 [Rhodopila sp.]